MTFDTLQASHGETIKAELKQPGEYLLLEGRSQLSWNGKQPIKGFGLVGGSVKSARGLLLHSALAVW